MSTTQISQYSEQKCFPQQQKCNLRLLCNVQTPICAMTKLNQLVYHPKCILKIIKGYFIQTCKNQSTSHKVAKPKITVATILNPLCDIYSVNSRWACTPQTHICFFRSYHTDRQTYRLTHRQINTQMNAHTHTHTCACTCTCAHTHTSEDIKSTNTIIIIRCVMILAVLLFKRG